MHGIVEENNAKMLFQNSMKKLNPWPMFPQQPLMCHS
jgi:hypothetical protein